MEGPSGRTNQQRNRLEGVAREQGVCRVMDAQQWQQYITAKGFEPTAHRLCTTQPAILRDYEEQYEFLRVSLSWLHYVGPLPESPPSARQQRRAKDKARAKQRVQEEERPEPEDPPPASLSPVWYKLEEFAQEMALLNQKKNQRMDELNA